MKHLHNFDTVAEYEAVKDTLEMPYIVSIDETDGLQYNTEVIRVPQGSVGSGGESGGDNLIYINMAGYSNYTYPSLAANLIKLELDGEIQIIPPLLYMSSNSVAPLAIAVNIDTIYHIVGENGVLTEMRYEDIARLFGSADVLSLPRLTKEQFYDLNA